MAKNSRNIVTHGLSGKLGDLIVFRQRGDETIVASKPKKQTGEPSEGQQEHRAHFLEAVLYGKTIMTDAAKKEVYQAAAACHRLCGPRHIVGTGCEVSPETPPENLRALVAYARDHAP